MIFIYNPNTPLPCSVRLLWNSPQPSPVLTNWNNGVRFNFITCPLLWIINRVHSRLLLDFCYVENKSVSLQAVRRNYDKFRQTSLKQFTALPLSGIVPPLLQEVPTRTAESAEESTHTPQLLPPAVQCTSLKKQRIFVCMNPHPSDMQRDKMQAYSPFGKLCSRSGSLQEQKQTTRTKGNTVKLPPLSSLWASQTLASLLSDVVAQRKQSYDSKPS